MSDIIKRNLVKSELVYIGHYFFHYYYSQSAPAFFKTEVVYRPVFSDYFPAVLFCVAAYMYNWAVRQSKESIYATLIKYITGLIILFLVIIIS